MVKEVTHNGLVLEYDSFGSGTQTVLCFHGHSRSAHDFRFLESYPLRVISINLFFHGNSFFPPERIEKDPLRAAEFKSLILQILEREAIENFSLLAFSQGGRFALKTLEMFPGKAESCTLMAPDGLNNHSFYNRTSRIRALRRLFLHFERKPNRLRKLMDIAVALRVVRPKVRDFVYNFSSDPRTFKRASRTWRAFRAIRTGPDAIGRIVREQQLPFRIIMGSWDKIIRPAQAYKFEEKAGLNNVITEIESGHQFFRSETLEKIIPLLPFLRL